MHAVHDVRACIAFTEGKSRDFRGKTTQFPIARDKVDCILRPVVQRFSLRARTCSPSQEKSMAAKKTGAKKGGARKGGAKKSSAKKGAAKKGGAKRAAKSGAKKGGAKKAAKRTPNAAFMRAMTPSAQLGSVVGTAPLPRTEVTKKLWAYIKRKGLQDAKNRRQINADENLKPIFGGKSSVSMFEMTKLVNKHLK